jgi:hypothetical protein
VTALALPVPGTVPQMIVAIASFGLPLALAAARALAVRMRGGWQPPRGAEPTRAVVSTRTIRTASRAHRPDRHVM